MNSQEMWQVEVQGHIYEADIEEIIEWINEGSVQPDDKVRKGSLRWLKAEKVPELYGYFHAHIFENESTVNVTLTNVASSTETSNNAVANYAASVKAIAPDELSIEKLFTPKTFEKEIAAEKIEDPPVSNGLCSVHSDLEAKFFCGTCLSLFCKNCPDSFGGNVKICIYCGAMCRIYSGEESLVKSVGAINKPYPRAELDLNSSDDPNARKFGLIDFGKALLYPLKFKTSFIFGALMFMFFTLGESVSAFGITMYFAAIICAMLANTLVFGCLANTIDNFSQGKTLLNFMPDFEDFNTWDDVIHPFFLSLAAYFISFGLLIILITGAIYYANDSENKIEADKQKIIKTILPTAVNSLNSIEQSQSSSTTAPTLLSPSSEATKSTGIGQNANLSDEKAFAQFEQLSKNQEDDLKKLKAEINQSVQVRLRQQISEKAQAEKENFTQTTGTIMRLSLVFSVPIFLALLWAIFYFPVACAIAGYSRSFTAILNPLVGFDTIRRLGFDYWKMMGMFLLLIVIGVVVNMVLQTLFSPLDLPFLGNLPAKAMMSLFVFYFSIVFSVILGFLLFRNSERLNFKRG